MLRREIPFLVFIFLTCNLLRAQTFNFKNYTDEDGLAQSYVYCVSQSSKGFLYLSTGDGFCKFDGNEFKTYTIKDNLAENFINTHFSDSRNITWIGHFQNGISYLSGNNFYKIKDSEKLETKINAFAEDKSKNIWVAAQQKGLYKIDSALKFTQLKSTENENFNSIYFDLDNQLLAATDEGLFLFKTEGQKEMAPVCIVSGFEGKKIKCIIPCDSLRNSFWVAVPGEGIFKILKAGSCYYIYSQIVEDLGSASINISTMYVDHSRNLWVGLLGEGLRKISFDRLNISNVLYINKQNGLSNEYVQSIFQDFEDNMWFGTSGGGLIEMPINKFSYFVPQTNVKSILTDSKTGNVYTGNDKGLFVLNLKHQDKNIQYNASNGFVNDQVNALMQDSAGNIWIGTAENGVFIFNPLNNKFENFSKKNNLKSLTINTISKTQAGNISIGTTDGLYFYNAKKNTVKLMTTLEGLMHNNIQQIYLDNKKRLWLSSHGSVPYYMKNDELTVLKNIPENYINSVAEDNAGLIWIATEDNGMVCYDGSDFKRYKTDKGLLSNFCYFVMVDANNTVWVGHKNGLSKKEDGQKLFKRVTKADGLLFQENNLNACYKDDKKNMWFGTTTGVVNFDCENNKINTHEPRTTILGVNLNDHFYAAAENISLPYKHYSARIDFIGVSLVDPTKVNYKYRMLGLDTIWRYTYNRYVEFPKIAEGAYTFQLLACNNDGIWNTTPVEITFEIDLPIWKKAWFYILATIGLVALVYIIIVWRTRKLIEARQLLEKMVDEKTFELKKEKEVVEHIKSELEEKNKDITDSINYAKRIQEAILPSKESILKVFPEAFILYKPKDIVSGDFYWFTETEDFYLVAAIDCTGHGVPGAFMSLIASTLIKEIVNGKKIYVPSEILQELNNSIIETLNQSDSDSSTRDGMDMSICCIDKKKSKLTFAGAARPLYFIRDKVLVDTKGQGYPIGGHYGLMNLTYSDTVMDLQKDDMFYIFSDGYADQFRDGDKKKFTSKRLKALLTEICDDDMKTQGDKLNGAFEDWKGAGSQIDDILVIGIKI
jgi:ligand-binding sensor domain-containing protein/serine phosphatase RsbU (regulator of sigma subunit)